MRALRLASRLGLMIGLVIEISLSTATAQPTAPKEAQPPASGSLKLTGEDAKRALELGKAIESALQADRWDEAIARAEELVGLRARVQGPKHFETVIEDWRLKAIRRVAPMPPEDHVAYQSADTMSEQAEALFNQQKYAEAQPLFEKALEIRRRLLTDDHTLTARSYHEFALMLDYQGNHAKAQPLLEKALEINRRLLGDDHPDTANTYNSLGLNLNGQGRYALAQPPYEKALEIRRRFLTDEDVQTAQSYNNVALNLYFQGKYVQAQPLFEKALEINRRLLTDDNIATATSYSCLAINLQAQGKYTLAQPSYEKALEIRRRVLSDDHPDTAKSFTNLSMNFYSQGKYALAQPLAEKALEIRRRLLTDEHIQTAQSYNALGLILSSQGKYEQAQPLAESALQINRRLLTDDSTETATCYGNLALNLNGQGKFALAQPLYEKALEIKRRLLTDKHRQTALCYSNLAYNLQSQGKYTLAQQLYEKVLEIRRGLLTEDHPDTAQTYNDLGVMLIYQGKHDQAQSPLEKALEIRRRLLPENHPDTAQSYNNVAGNLDDQGRYPEAQPLYEKALAIRLKVDDMTAAANSYLNVANNLQSQGKYAEAQPRYEKALEIRRRLFTDDHPDTANTYKYLAANLNALGKYTEARDRWLDAARGQDKARLRVAFSGLERAGTDASARPALAAVLARLAQPVLAWQALEDDFGRGLLDELAARQDDRLTPAERDRLRELTDELERIDKLMDATPKGLNQAELAKHFEDLGGKRQPASIALGEFQAKLIGDHDALAGKVATLAEIQAALPADSALLAWVDVAPAGPGAADPDGEHWGVVVRSKGVPTWVPIDGTGPDGLWTKDDTALAGRVRAELRNRPGASSEDLRSLIERLRERRLGPLAGALAVSPDGLPASRRLIILPSQAMTGIPIEVLLAADDVRTVCYAPSATVFKYLQGRPRPDRQAGLLALGDPVYERANPANQPQPTPDHGLLINVVAPGSNAATHGLKDGDVLLAYNGTTLNQNQDFKVVAGGDRPVEVEVWRDGKSSRKELAPGPLGVVIDTRPAPQAIAERRELQRIFVAARSGDEPFIPLPGTRSEVEAIARTFRADDRPARVLLEADASEPELDRLAASRELGRFGFIHLATHGVIDQAVPQRSAVILTQVGLPDPLEQVLHQRPAYDGRLSVREIQRGWDLKAELVTLSACDTALGREQGGEGFVGFAQALLMSGTRSVCLSLWKVDDTATALLMGRFYENLLGRRPGLTGPLPKAEALREAKAWLRSLGRAEVLALTAEQSGGIERGKGAKALRPGDPAASVRAGLEEDRPFASPHFWAAFVLTGNPD